MWAKVHAYVSPRNSAGMEWAQPLSDRDVHDLLPSCPPLARGVQGKTKVVCSVDVGSMYMSEGQGDGGKNELAPIHGQQDCVRGQQQGHSHNTTPKGKTTGVMKWHSLSAWLLDSWVIIVDPCRCEQRVLVGVSGSGRPHMVSKSATQQRSNTKTVSHLWCNALTDIIYTIY